MHNMFEFVQANYTKIGLSVSAGYTIADFADVLAPWSKIFGLISVVTFTIIAICNYFGNRKKRRLEIQKLKEDLQHE